MAELIVDFPRRPRGARQVRFSHHADVRFYRRPNESSELHYTDEDYATFKASNRYAIRDLNRRYLSLLSNKEDKTEEFQGCDLIGIENQLTPELVRKGMARRRMCLNAVLEEQKRQQGIDGRHEPERLASVSENYSRRAVQRALAIAVMHQY